MVGVAQLVEHLVVVQDVAGSSPVTHPKGSRESRAAVLRRSEQKRLFVKRRRSRWIPRPMRKRPK
jgi:hypothetical protein